MEAIKKMLEELGIDEYRILRHRFSVSTFTAFMESEVVFDKDSFKTIEFIYLVFNYNGLLHKVTLPPAGEDAATMLINNCIKYNRCSIRPPSNHPRIENRKNTERSFQVDPKSIKAQINMGLTICAEKGGLSHLSLTHTYICHHLNLFTPYEEYEQSTNRHHIFLRWEDADGFSNEMLEARNSMERGYEDIINSLSRDCVVQEIDPSALSFKHLSGLILFKADVLKLFFELLSDCLNGYNISIDSVFVRKEDFGKKFFDAQITITDNPLLDCQVVIDDEGSPLVSKCLIDEGILTQCLNDLNSATLLNQSAGNAVYSESKKSIEIKRSFWDVAIIPSTADYVPDIRVIGVENDFIYLDAETGYMSCTIIGLDVKQNTYYKFCLAENFVNFMNRILCSTGDVKVLERMRLTDAILNFSE